MSQRLKRVNELLKQEISLIFQKDFDFTNALVTVNAVEITTDLKQAMVYVGILGADKEQERSLEQMTKRRGFIQGRIAKRITLRETPQLMFRVDDSVARGTSVISMMEDIEIPDELPPETGTFK